jgi:hypothetical protein
MSRPKKQTVDYFPHDCNHKKTMFILESQFGNDGYAFWFKLLELLGNTEGHFYDCRDEHDWGFLLAKTRLDEETTNRILNTLSKLQAIDPELWEQKIIWSQNFVDRLEDVYKRRLVNVPIKPTIKNKCQQKPASNGINVDGNPQSKVKESKVKESIYIVFEKYKEIFKDYHKREPLLTDKRIKKIKARLKRFSEEELIMAMQRISKSDWHIGKNPNSKFYATPEFCFRNDEKVENWLNEPEKTKAQDLDAWVGGLK